MKKFILRFWRDEKGQDLVEYALLLSVFEGMPLEDVAILLDGEIDLVRKAQTIGLRELTRNLARIQGWTSTGNKSGVVTSEMQHA